jgi:hypothetical protein
VARVGKGLFVSEISIDLTRLLRCLWNSVVDENADSGVSCIRVLVECGDEERKRLREWG